MARLLAYYPAVGVVMGALGAVLGYLVVSIKPEFPMLAGFIVVALWVVLTGAFHIDGLADTFDALLSGQSGDRAGKIMKDSRIGAMGAVAIFVVLSVKVICVGYILGAGGWGSLIVAATVGRMWGAVAGWMGPSPSWVREASIGRWIVGHMKPSDAVIAGVTTVVAGLLFAWPLAWLVMAAAAGLAGWLLTLRCRTVVGGVTGDVIGAGIEIAETVALIAALFCL